MGLFDKKYCSICGEKIGFLGNRQLEDGNLCKDCAKKLSPYLTDRRQSTVEEIRRHLQYREENKRVLLGSRQLMMNHSIEGLPTPAKEEEYAKGNMVLYLSVSGICSMLFVVEAKASLSVSKWLRELGKNGIVSVVRTVDGFIDKEFLSKLFKADPKMIKLLPFRFHNDYLRETDYTPQVSSPMLCSGHFPSFAMLLIGTKRLKQISILGVAIQAGACVLGLGIALITTLLGTFGQLSPTFIFIYNMVFLLITLSAQRQRV